MTSYSNSRGGAIILAALFAVGTAYVLFEDVLRHSAPITTAHILTGLALIGTIAAGHYVIGEARAWRLLPAAGLAVLFLAGTAYIITASGVRNAEVATWKATALAADVDRRAKLAGDIEAARRDHTHAAAEAKRECVKVGTQCQRKTDRVAAAWSRVADLERQLAAAAPARAPDAGYRHLGNVLATLGWPGSAEAIAAALAMIQPYILVLIAELGTLCFGHIALRQHAATPAPGDSAQTSYPVTDLPAPDVFAPIADEPPQPPRGSTRRAKPNERREQVASFVTAYRARHGADPSPAAVRKATGLPRATAWRWQQQVA